MTPHDETTFDPRIADWLEDDANTAPDQALDIVLAAFPSIKQRHASRLPWRFPMTTLPKLALGAAAIVVVVLAGAFLVRPPTSGTGGDGPTASPSPIQTTTPPSTSPSPSAALGPIDTTTWATYTSARYGFSIGHPAGWMVTTATRAWVFPADATCCPPTGTETFHSPANDIGVSVWSLALPTGTTADAWIQAYCQVMEPDSPCTALQGSTVPASMDGHAGRLVRFRGDTQAFIPVGNTLYVVACWRPEDDPSVVPFDGATRLVEGYLSTMRLVPGGPASQVPSATP